MPDALPCQLKWELLQNWLLKFDKQRTLAMNRSGTPPTKRPTINTPPTKGVAFGRPSVGSFVGGVFIVGRFVGGVFVVVT